MKRTEKRRSKKLAGKIAKKAEPIPAEQEQTLTVQQAIDLALQYHNAGDLSKAESIYNQIIQIEPNQPIALHLLGVIAHQVGKNDIAVELITKAISIKPDLTEAHSNLGHTLKDLGELDKAVKSYQKAVFIKPDFAEAHNNLGTTLQELGQLEEAVKSYQKAIDINSNYAEAHNNLSVSLNIQGKLVEAISSCSKAIEIKPDYPEAFNNQGNALQGLGRLDKAVECYNKAIAIKPQYAEAYSNLGNVLQELGQLEEAMASSKQAIFIKPDYAEAYSNLGNVYRELGQLDKAIAYYNKAIAIKSDYPEAYSNQGNALQQLGMLDEAVNKFTEALSIKPDYPEANDNLKFTIKAFIFSKTSHDYKGLTTTSSSNDVTLTPIKFSLQQYYLNGFRPHEADESFNKVIKMLPTIVDQTVPIDRIGRQHATVAKLPNKIVALLHLGRSGTGLFHSLIDGHPDITTLPSIYLRGYFNEGVWEKISADGWRGIPAHFADEFAVLFDARTSKPIPSRLGESPISIGVKEGMTSVGENRDQFLSLDKEAFCVVALNLMEGMESIDPMSFLMVAHAAFEEVIKAHKSSELNKRLCFYHIHNPDDYAMANFIRYAPDTQLLVTVREPIQNCESWICSSVEQNNYNQCVHRILGVIFGFDRVPFRMRDTVGIRLEDLKARPEATMKALCTWLNVEDSPTLYEMTVQGQKWWGNPTDPGFNAKRADPFDKTSVRRPVGKVFGAIDRFVLQTLLYPFSVRYGYREPAPEQFQKELKEIRPLIDDMLDFEKAMAKRLNVDHAQFKKQGSYQLFRAGMVDRWNVLNELGDYPHMLTPLYVE